VLALVVALAVLVVVVEILVVQAVLPHLDKETLAAQEVLVVIQQLVPVAVQVRQELLEAQAVLV
jgi:hypothetical protein